MKYKDFKKMTKDEMKEVKGGNQPAEEGCLPEGTPCGNGKKCNYDSTVGSCLCGSVNDQSCYAA